MKIEQIKLQNFRGWGEKQFDLMPHFNLIIGDNGSGKSSLLDGLSIAIGSWLLGIGGMDSRHIRDDEIRHQQIASSKKINLEPQFPVKIEAQGIILGQSLTWTRNINARGGKTRWVKAKNIKNLARDAAEKVSQGVSIDLPLIAYYGTGRRWQEPKDTKNFFTTRLDGYRCSIDPRISVNVFKEWLKSQEFEAWQEGEASHLYKVVTQAVVSCIEDCEEIRYYEKHKSVAMKLTGGDFLPFGQLSDGQKTMLAMVGDIAMKAALLNPRYGVDVLQKTEGVVLIDEIDLHLHPRWQRNVVENLRTTFPKIQFIATTHSPFMVQSIRADELINLNENKEPAEYVDKSIEDIAEDVMDVETPQRSDRYLALEKTATRYFELLESAENGEGHDLKKVKQKLDKLAGLYDDKDMKRRLVNAFVGTATNAFDQNFDPVERTS